MKLGIRCNGACSIALMRIMLAETERGEGSAPPRHREEFPEPRQFWVNGYKQRERWTRDEMKRKQVQIKGGKLAQHTILFQSKRDETSIQLGFWGRGGCKNMIRIKYVMHFERVREISEKRCKVRHMHLSNEKGENIPSDGFQSNTEHVKNTGVPNELKYVHGKRKVCTWSIENFPRGEGLRVTLSRWVAKTIGVGKEDSRKSNEVRWEKYCIKGNWKLVKS